MNDTDSRYMRLALSLGRRNQGSCWPNPSVGCVIVNGTRVVGRGWTAQGGRPHAETEALVQAGSAARGATAYVSLEPCAHHGKTPPCSHALIDAGIARVVAPLEDRDPRVAGQGFRALRAAGLEVTVGVLRTMAEAAHAGFFARLVTGRPRVTLKLASSFDGRIATATGESQWITGPLARRLVHGLRSAHDAVLVGAGTARADDPTLTVRDLGIARQPVRIVASRRLDVPLLGQLARTAGEVPVWLCHGTDADPERCRAWSGVGAKLIACKTDASQLDPADMLSQLGQAGLTSVFCEGGSALAASLLAADLVDELVGFTAGFAIGAEGLPAIGALGLARLQTAPRFELREARPIGDDLLQRWVRKTD